MVIKNETDPEVHFVTNGAAVAFDENSSDWTTVELLLER